MAGSLAWSRVGAGDAQPLAGGGSSWLRPTANGTLSTRDTRLAELRSILDQIRVLASDIETATIKESHRIELRRQETAIEDQALNAIHRAMSALDQKAEPAIARAGREGWLETRRKALSFPAPFRLSLVAAALLVIAVSGTSRVHHVPDVTRPEAGVNASALSRGAPAERTVLGPAASRPPARERGQAPRPTEAEVTGRLVVRDRRAADRALADLAARVGGAEVASLRESAGAVVEFVVPTSGYPDFAARLAGLGRWLPDRLDRKPEHISDAYAAYPGSEAFPRALRIRVRVIGGSARESVIPPTRSVPVTRRHPALSRSSSP
jgi:hypothetical protein